jgi:hypothetical protein
MQARHDHASRPGVAHRGVAGQQLLGQTHPACHCQAENISLRPGVHHRHPLGTVQLERNQQAVPARADAGDLDPGFLPRRLRVWAQAAAIKRKHPGWHVDIHVVGQQYIGTQQPVGVQTRSVAQIEGTGRDPLDRKMHASQH